MNKEENATDYIDTCICDDIEKLYELIKELQFIKNNKNNTEKLKYYSAILLSINERFKSLI